MPIQWQHEQYTLTDDPSAIDFDALHTFLAHIYWSRGIPADVLRRAVEHSFCFSLVRAGSFVGFVRVITDQATFAYVCDVFVLPEHRGQGLATWMMSCVLAHPTLRGLRRWSLVTRDADHVYERVGFGAPPSTAHWMEKTDPDIYTRETGQHE